MSILDSTAARGARKPAAPKRDHAIDWEHMERLALDNARLAKEVRAREIEIERLTTELKGQTGKAEEATARAEQLQRDLSEQRARAATDIESTRTALAHAESQRAAEAATATALREQLVQAQTIREQEPVDEDNSVRARLAALEQTLQALPNRIEKGLELGVGKMAQAVSVAIAARPVPPAPTYEMQVTRRDGSNRPQTIRLKPVAKE